MTLDDLEAIEKLASACTPGPWWVVPMEDTHTIEAANPNALVASTSDYGVPDAANAAFIAAARTAVPALAAEVRRQGVEIERLRALPAIEACGGCAFCHQSMSRHDRGGETVCARENDRITNARAAPPDWCPLRRKETTR